MPKVLTSACHHALEEVAEVHESVHEYGVHEPQAFHADGFKECTQALQ